MVDKIKVEMEEGADPKTFSHTTEVLNLALIAHCLVGNPFRDSFH